MIEPLTIIPPLSVTDAMITASDVPENDYTEWVVGTTYALGDRVIISAQHKIYESLEAGNVGNNPITATTKWIVVSSTNKYKLFDTKNNSSTSQPLSMTYTLEPSSVINAVGFINVSASTVEITMTDPVDGVVYNNVVNLLGDINGSTWYNYFFDIVTPVTQLVLTDLPAYGSADIKVDFDATTGNVSCGSLVLGYQRSFGEGVEHGASVGIVDYSRKESNDFGDLELVERAFSNRFDFSMLMNNTEIQPLFNLLSANRANPLLWVGHRNYESTIVFGFYKDFEVTISYPTLSNVNIDVEGLT